MLYARVEHKELWAIIVILLTSMSYFQSAVFLDEAARTDITRTLRETGSTDVLCTQVAGEVYRPVCAGKKELGAYTHRIMVMHSNEKGECCPRTLVDRKRKR